MTEICTPLISGANPAKDSICGRPRAGVEVRLVDEHDCSVGDGEVGQLILRTEAPWAMNHGYNNNPQATADAWRNGWFHTGDAFIRDADGDYRFVDRLKDAIRRRGENISSYEIEVELLSHPSVREAAAIPVPSEFSEDEVLVVLAPASGASIDPEDIIRHLLPRDGAPHGAALYPDHRRAAENPDRQGRKTRPARRRPDRGHLGPRTRRHRRSAARKSDHQQGTRR